MSPLEQLHVVDNYTPPPPLQEIPFNSRCTVCTCVCLHVSVRVSTSQDRGETAVKRDGRPLSCTDLERNVLTKFRQSRILQRTLKFVFFLFLLSFLTWLICICAVPVTQ